ncbi:hypothetical protein CANCADRAFT_1238 [Tortispora caseinolytica NRRL Y-17796]|uniref:Ornithine decarboxylase antizyme n=1 Tax=Tortispora caseinolytica NRRL Y-17796 TaxID=767744 RepID=A0A1E4TLP9_9ASCO|nr:hypothetical protein CANCADRAFT_1238 [Tortispora caseinolytica NRRL Y-17796]
MISSNISSSGSSRDACGLSTPKSAGEFHLPEQESVQATCVIGPSGGPEVPINLRPVVKQQALRGLARESERLFGKGSACVSYMFLWDLIQGSQWKGIVTDSHLYVFYDLAHRTNLKQGLMCLLDLASECLNCEQVSICLPRDAPDVKVIASDLYWVGFQLSPGPCDTWMVLTMDL